MAGQAGDAFDFRPGVGFGVVGLLAVGVAGLLPGAKVEAAGEFAHDGEVGAAGDVGLERGGGEEAVGREEAGAEVAKGGHLLAQLEQAFFRPDLARGPFLSDMIQLVFCFGAFMEGLGSGMVGLMSRRSKSLPDRL